MKGAVYFPLTSSDTSDNKTELGRLKELLFAQTILNLKEVKQVSIEFQRQRDLIDMYPPPQKNVAEKAVAKASSLMNMFSRKEEKPKESKAEVAMSESERRSLNYKYQKLADAIKNLHLLDPEIKKSYKALNYPTVNWGYVGCAALAIGVLAIKFTPLPVKLVLGMTCFAACMASIYYGCFKEQGRVVLDVNQVKLEIAVEQSNLKRGIEESSKGMKDNPKIVQDKDSSVFISNLNEFSKIYSSVEPHLKAVTELLADKKRNASGCILS